MAPYWDSLKAKDLLSISGFCGIILLLLPQEHFVFNWFAYAPGLFIFVQSLVCFFFLFIRPLKSTQLK